MYLIQILLPLWDNEGRPQPHDLFAAVRKELAGRFGGLTAFTRAPAEGLWHDAGETTADDIVVLEVMTGAVDRPWWAAYRVHLEERFRQQVVVIRATVIDLL